jgi:hypothetical protein
MDRFRLPSAALSRSRRRFVQGLAGGALAAVSARHFGWAAAEEPAAAGDAGAMLACARGFSANSGQIVPAVQAAFEYSYFPVDISDAASPL